MVTNPLALAPDREGWIRLPDAPVYVVGLQVPEAWLGWSDEERLDYLRDALKKMGRPKSGYNRDVALAMRKLRNRLTMRVWRANH